MSAPDDILAANAAFYKAFAEGDMAAMANVWARHAPVACVHPGCAPLMGREAVLASWRDLLRAPEPVQIRVQNIGVQGHGDAALVLCGEVVNGRAALAASNLFIREEGEWRLVLHQSGQIMPPVMGGDSDNDAPERRGPQKRILH